MDIDKLNSLWQHLYRQIRQNWPLITEQDFERLMLGQVDLLTLLQQKHGLSAAEAQKAVDQLNKIVPK